MAGKIFIAVMIVMISCGLAVGRVLNCSDGENYWCMSVKTAQRCDKQEYCQKIWNPVEDEVVIKLLTAPSPSELKARPGLTYHLIHQAHKHI